MKNLTRTTAAIAGGAIIGTAVSVAVGRAMWDRETAGAVVRLLAGMNDVPAGYYSPNEIANLPAPVQRYFRFALTPGQPYVRRMKAVQEGSFRMGGIRSGWKPLTAVQYFNGPAPGFVWDAYIGLFPLLSVRVRDSYLEGKGAMHVKLASTIPLVNAANSTELAAGALHRYLAEAVWLPTALLPSQGVEWQPIDDLHARATLGDRGNCVSLDFTFGENGEIVSTYTPARGREAGGISVPTPWRCTYGDYRPAVGMMIPFNGLAAWILPEGELPYCRVEIKRLEFDGLNYRSVHVRVGGSEEFRK